MSAEQDVYIETHLNGFVLDIEEGCQANGAKVISFPRNSPPSPNQLWYLDYQPDGSFLIVSKLNGKVLDCVGEKETTWSPCEASWWTLKGPIRLQRLPSSNLARTALLPSNQQFSIESA
ncbi:hypothetical protein EMCRGX_G007510 [Ephydatia muelleri]